MDAPKDRDLELQRASGDLINEFKTKLPHLLWKSAGGTRQLHRWAQCSKTEKLRALLEPFQEWPQLLDPHLSGVLGQLTEAFLVYLESYRDQYASTAAVRIHCSEGVEPLARAICNLLYTMCKVRGVKVILRFLNNEPKYLEPLLRAFIDWDTIPEKDVNVQSHTVQRLPLTWEERYIILYWLSHLFLAPFDLVSISSNDVPIPCDNLSAVAHISSAIPPIVQSALSISLHYMVLPGKERDAAVSLLARLALRPDMQSMKLLDVLCDWAFTTLISQPADLVSSEFRDLGILSFIARLSIQGQLNDLEPHIASIFDNTAELLSERTAISNSILSSAAARKAVVKVLRSMTILAVTSETKRNCSIDGKTAVMLEFSIDQFLKALGDSDTPVRLTASKALSMVALKLDPDMASDIVEAVFDLLQENVLYEMPDGSLQSKYEALKSGFSVAKPSTSAVDPQQWQGLILTLGHLLCRQAIPPNCLGLVLQFLISGLRFEQRSTTGSSIGVGVRDASCFGIWTVARKFSTREILSILPTSLGAGERKESILQVLALELVCAACLDPSGNIRRGSSAALQELVGRHPDMISEGISLVQIVDYHAVARRTRALHEVTKATAALGPLYWEGLFDGLLQWRGIGSSDSQSRRIAAIAIGELSIMGGCRRFFSALSKSLDCLQKLTPYAVESRHGCFLSLAAIIESFLDYLTENFEQNSDVRSIVVKISEIWDVLESKSGPSNESLTLSELRPDLTAEATARLLSSLSRSLDIFMRKNIAIKAPCQRLFDRAVELLILCAHRSDETCIDASSQAASDLLVILPPEGQMNLVKGRLESIDSSWKSATGRGQIAVIGAAFQRLPTASQGRTLILNGLLKSTGKEELILKRSSAVKCLATGILPYIGMDDIESISHHFRTFLDDYTTDRRGDIGSFIRIEAIEGVNYILRSSPTRPLYVHDLMKGVVRLAAEKLDKVRFEAWKCVETFWGKEPTFPPLQVKFNHLSDVSSVKYFSQLFDLLSVDWIRESLIKGAITSLVAGTEGVISSSRLALIRYLREQEENKRDQLYADVLNDLVTVLETVIDDDRYAIPATETLAFLLENCPDLLNSKFDFQRLFIVVQKSHFKSSSIPRIEAAVKVYSSIVNRESILKSVLRKLTSLLLHPYPKVRSVTAENLYMNINDDSLRSGDWYSSPQQLKRTVQDLQQKHQV